MGKWKAFLLRSWSIPEKALLLTDVALAGVLVGWLTSPLGGKKFRRPIIGTDINEIYKEDEKSENENKEEEAL